jgi:hypothetical protein
MQETQNFFKNNVYKYRALFSADPGAVTQGLEGRDYGGIVSTPILQ